MRRALAEDVVPRRRRAEVLDLPRQPSELVPHPARAVVQPGRVIVSLAPGAFLQRDPLAWRVAGPILPRRRDARATLRPPAQHEAEPVDAPRPPVAREVPVGSDRGERIGDAPG